MLRPPRSGPGPGLACSAPLLLIAVALLWCLTATHAVRTIGVTVLGPDCRDKTGRELCGPYVGCASTRGCTCKPGYVQLSGRSGERLCFPERTFNETCEHEDQCVDFRLRCREGVCVCVKYYYWDEYSGQCVTLNDLQYMLNDMEEKHHSAGRVVSEANHVFTGMLWTGLAVMVFGLVLASGCLVYSCCSNGRVCGYQLDKMAKPRRKAMSSSEQSQRTRETTVRTNTGQVDPPESQGTGVDFIPALYETSFNVV